MNKSLEIFKKVKKDEIGIDHLVNIWMEEFFNIVVKEAFEKKKYENSFDFYNDYQVTQEQHDWWVETVKPLFKKKFKLNEVNLGYNWGMMYLDCSPKIKK